MTAVSSVADVDAWIAQLSECKQLPESEIKKLCEKVYSKEKKKKQLEKKRVIMKFRPVKSLLKSPTSSL
jgi:hypothetical protein